VAEVRALQRLVLTALTRSRRQVAAWAVLALSAGALGAACQSGSDPSPQVVHAVVTGVPEKTTQAGSYATEFRYTVEANDSDNNVIGFEGSGVFDIDAHRGRMVYRFDHHSQNRDGVISMTAVHDGETILVSPDISLSLMDQPLDLQLWIPIPVDDNFSLDLGLSLLEPAVDLEKPFSQVRQHDPTRTLSTLYGVDDDVEVLDRARIRGVDTTHYRAAISFDGALGNWQGSEQDRTVFELTSAEIEEAFGVHSYPVDLWVSDDGLPMRISYRIESSDPTGPTVTFVQDFFDFGTPIDVEVPEPSGSFGETLAEVFQEILGPSSSGVTSTSLPSTTSVMPSGGG